MSPPSCSSSLANCAMAGDPHHPVSPTMLIHVVPEGGVGGISCGDSLTGVSITGGSGMTVIGGAAGVGDEGVPPPHQVPINAHHRTTAASRIRGRARMELHSIGCEPVAADNSSILCIGHETRCNHCSHAVARNCTGA